MSLMQLVLTKTFKQQNLQNCNEMKSLLRLHHNPFSTHIAFFSSLPFLGIVPRTAPSFNTCVLIFILESASQETQLSAMAGVVQEH